MHNLSISEPPNLRDHTDYGCDSCCVPDENGNIDPGCKYCHEFDIDYALSNECQLCYEIMIRKIEEGWICKIHPRAYCELGWCEGCHPDGPTIYPVPGV